MPQRSSRIGRYPRCFDTRDGSLRRSKTPSSSLSPLNAEFDSPGTWFQFGIRSRETGDLVGDLGVHFLEDGEQVEIGFTVAPSRQGRGFGTEAVAGLLEYLFGTLGKHRVFVSVDPRNEPSLRLLRRLGMRQEAHFVQSVRSKGEWTDDIVAAVLASEWIPRMTGA